MFTNELVSFIVTEMFSYDISYSSDGFNRMELDKHIDPSPLRPDLKFISTYILKILNAKLLPFLKNPTVNPEINFTRSGNL